MAVIMVVIMAAITGRKVASEGYCLEEEGFHLKAALEDCCQVGDYLLKAVIEDFHLEEDCRPKEASMGYLLAAGCLLKGAFKDHLKAASEGFHLEKDYRLMVA